MTAPVGESAARTTVLVTGGAGFIGSHLVDALVAAGHRVRVLDDFSTGKRENLERSRSQIEVCEADVRDGDVVRQAAAGCEIVYHEAAIASVPLSFEQPGLVLDVNVGGTKNVLEAAPLQPGSPYAEAKLAGEFACHDAAATTGGLECVCLRYFNVFGPRQDPSSDYSGVIARFAEAAKRGAPCTVYGDGRQTRDFIYVADVVRANLLAASCALRDGQPVNVGSGVETSVLDILRALEAVIDRGRSDSPQHSRRRSLDVLHLPARQGDVRRSVAATELASKALGFTAEWSFAEGLQATLFPQASSET